MGCILLNESVRDLTRFWGGGDWEAVFVAEVRRRIVLCMLHCVERGNGKCILVSECSRSSVLK